MGRETLRGETLNYKLWLPCGLPLTGRSKAKPRGDRGIPDSLHEKERKPSQTSLPALSIAAHSTNAGWHHGGASVRLPRICLLVLPDRAAASLSLWCKSP